MQDVIVRISETGIQIETALGRHIIETALKSPPAQPSGAIVEPAKRERFVKIDANGQSIGSGESGPWVAVLDTANGLIWSADDVGSGEQKQADAAKSCASIGLCGWKDWRLPTIRELQSLVDFERHEPAIDTAFFQTCRSTYYWTSTPAAWSPRDYAWIVYFDGGDAGYFRRDHHACVRAVRSVAPASGQ